MAFSNVRTVPAGGGLTWMFGDFTATVGAAAQTIAVAAGKVRLVQINPEVSAEPVDVKNLYSVSTSGAISTLTIYTNAGISAGTFTLLVDNGG